MVLPGNPEETQYIKLPQMLQKWLVIEFPLATVLVMVNLVISSCPRTYFKVSSLMMKYEANMEKVILRSSVQVAYELGGERETVLSRKKEKNLMTHCADEVVSFQREGQVDCTSETC